MSPPTAVLRRAIPAEAPALTALALRSKAHWGYHAAFMQAAIPELTITAALLGLATSYVAERNAGPVGFYVLSVEDGVPTLRDLWVEPPAIGSGVGALLFVHMLVEARKLGFSTVQIESDPHAEPFYLRMGARRIGTVESKIVPGRMLPVMEIETEGS